MVDVISSIRADLYRLYSTWMSMRYPRFDNPHSVVGKYNPDGFSDTALYYSWSLIGAIWAILLYPFVLIGLGLNLVGSGLKSAVYRLGFIGTSIVILISWGGLVGGMIYLYGFQDSISVILSVAVSIIAVIVAAASHKYLGSRGMVLVGYPAIYTALFLPPITAAVVSPDVGGDILRQSVLFAEYILNTFASPLSIENWLRSTFELAGIYHIVLWFSISIVLGWVSGGFMKLSNLARPN